MANFEIEIKSLLGGRDQAKSLIESMKRNDFNMQSLGSHKQLNHYFVGENLQNITGKVKKHIADENKAQELDTIVSQIKDYSVRTRWADARVYFIVKGAIDDTTSSNGTARIEFEAEVAITMDQLDKILLDNGFTYQAKWSREREDYKYKDLNVSIDKNAGYGYLAEFEKITDDESKADEIKAFIRDCMKTLQVEELNQDRLARMFDYYNKNWEEYYGTDKVFNVE